MSINNRDESDDPQGGKQVLDEEGTVDEKVKNRILKARERVDDAEAALFVDAPASDTPITPAQQHVGYRTIVRQYIRAIKPLLTSSEIPASDYYFAEVLLFKQEVPPPDGQYNWSRYYHESVDEQKITRDMGLSPGFEPPEPKEVKIQGLQEILERDEVTLRWSFDLNGSKGVAQTDVQNLSQSISLPKRVYDSAVEHADAFLQQAGIGLEIGSGDLDEDQLAPDY